MTPTTDIVQKLWDLCHVVRDNESLRYQTSPCIPSRSQKCAKFVTLRSFETGANCLASAPSVECLSRLAIALLNPGSRYEIIPIKLSRLQALGWEIRIILIKL
ncbi:MAG TPA: hypothetical protein V6D43_00420 [Candidatus Sericytochromatia bacterium]